MRFKTVVIRGVTYPLRFTHNSVAEVEHISGRGLMQLFNMSVAATRFLLWAALTHKLKNLTIARAGELMDDYAEEHGSVDQLAKDLYELLVDQGFIVKPTKQTEEEALAAADEARLDPPSPTTTTSPSTGETAPTAG